MLLLVGLALPVSGWGQSAERIGTILALEGTAEVRSATASTWERLRFRDAIFLNDTVRTATASKVKVLLRDDSILTLAEQSEMQFTEFLVGAQQQRSVISLVLGKVRVLKAALVGGSSETEIHTPNAVAGVRGSEEYVDYASGARQTTTLCVSGDCYMRDPRNPNRVLTIPEGHIAQQIGAVFPTQTREATADERQAITAAAQATEQDPDETQTTEQQARQRLQEPEGPLRGETPGTRLVGPVPSTVITAGLVIEPLAGLPGGVGGLVEAFLFPTPNGPGTPLGERIDQNSQLTNLPSPDAGPAGQGFVVETLVPIRVDITIPR
jgi:hypothetical protein